MTQLESYQTNALSEKMPCFQIRICQHFNTPVRFNRLSLPNLDKPSSYSDESQLKNSKYFV